MARSGTAGRRSPGRDSSFQISACPIGAHVVIRDTVWRVTDVRSCNHGDHRLTCEGLSEMIRGRRGIFFVSVETEHGGIRVISPEETVLRQDLSPRFISSRIFIEAALRSCPRNDPSTICTAHKAVMDPLPYQFDPAMEALKRPRARILIADAVGIGKTLEAGILASELAVRGRARRILVVATKAMMLQFQQEFWNRFAIPLCRLDSQGLTRCVNRIPVNRNPFDYYDRAIISVDTLKQEFFLSYLEHARWDLIIIDEAHNVALRGKGGGSSRARLAERLSTSSENLIMLSATPHDGSLKSFASLLNILDPTAIPDEEHYTADDFAGRGLVIRRFKSDVRDQILREFPDRVVYRQEIPATPQENAVFDLITGIYRKEKENGHGHHPGRGHFLATVLIKAAFSSPAALLSVVKNRLKTLERSGRGAVGGDLVWEAEALNDLVNLTEQITPGDFSKLTALISMLRKKAPLDWDPSDPADRLVIFTESVRTMHYLAEILPKELKLKKDQIATLCGEEMDDTRIMETINEFNRRSSPIRLLICTDIASEGINLHHLSHRMIHFDLPWSLMTYQQRNGRIDRYGQEREPQILYLMTLADDRKTVGDLRILEKLTERDDRARESLGDQAEFLESKDEQEDRTKSLVDSWDPDGDRSEAGAARSEAGEVRSETETEPETQHGSRETGSRLNPGTETQNTAAEALEESLEDIFGLEDDLEEDSSQDTGSVESGTGTGMGADWNEFPDPGLDRILNRDQNQNQNLNGNLDRSQEQSRDQYHSRNSEHDRMAEEARRTLQIHEGFAQVMEKEEYNRRLDRSVSLFSSDLEYARAILEQSEADGRKSLEYEITDDGFRIALNENLRDRLPPEMIPANGKLTLTSDRKRMLEEIAQFRTSDEDWPAVQPLLPLHPVMHYLNDQALSQFGRCQAPVLQIESLPPGEIWVLLQGGFPNNTGYSPVHEIAAVKWKNGSPELKSVAEFLRVTGLGMDQDPVNTGGSVSIDDLKPYLGPSAEFIQEDLYRLKKETEKSMQEGLRKRELEIEYQKEKRLAAIREKEKNLPKEDLDKSLKEAEAHFARALDREKDNVQLSVRPHVQILAVATTK